MTEWSKLKYSLRFGLALSLYLIAAVAVVLFAIAGYGRPAVAVTVLAVILSVAKVNIRVAILCVMAFAIVLGDFRRLLVPQYGWSGADPLLLVSGIVAIVLFAYALAAQRVKFDTPLSKAVLLLMAIMALQIFNPRQGGLMVGIAGAMFMMVPLFWYWVGKAYGNEEMLKAVLFKIVILLGVVAAVYGTYNVFYGYVPHQQAWLEINYYAGLGDPANPAPVSLFASNTEYGAFLVLANTAAWALFLRGRRPAILFIPIFLGAILLTGSRGPVAFALAGMVGMWAVLGRSFNTWVIRGCIAAVIALMGLTWTLTQSASLGFDEDVQGRLDRQAQEFVVRGEGGEHLSSAAHLNMMLRGYTFPLSEPLGFGLGSTTQAGRFGDGRHHTTETNLGDSFVALGLPGGVVYHIMVFFVMLTGFRYWLRTRSLVALAVLGVLAVTFGNWVSGGLYAVSTVTLFCIGALDRVNRELEKKEDKQLREPVQARGGR